MNKDYLRFFMAIATILLILMIYQKYMAQYTVTETVENTDTLAIQDSTIQTQKEKITPKNNIGNIKVVSQTDKEEKTFVIDNGLRKFVFSNRGGSVKSILIEDFTYTGTDSAIVLADSNYYLTDVFVVDGNRIETDSLLYTVLYKPNTERINKEDSVVFSFAINGNTMTKKFVIYPDSFNVLLECAGNTEYKWGIAWDGGVLPTEGNLKDDLNSFKGFAGTSGGKTLFKYSYKNLKKGEISMTAIVDFVGVKSKYFISALIPVESDKTDGYVFYMADKDNHASISYEIFYQRGVNPTMIWYSGPADYDILQSISSGFGNVVDFGWKYFAPIGKLILKIFKFLHKFIPNYGFVIIIFTILLFFLFFPITFKSFVSMRKMQALQPMIKELQTKYKNDAQKLNAEMMKLYKENGVNPMSGCFPMLLQLPIFFALFAVLRTNIALRGEPFIGWITDLSVKDPYYILPILTGIAMFISQKISNTDPKQKMMVYLMPAMMVFFFMNFPAGVLLYWVTYNIISIFQQYMVSRHPHVRGLQEINKNGG